MGKHGCKISKSCSFKSDQCSMHAKGPGDDDDEWSSEGKGKHLYEMRGELGAVSRQMQHLVVEKRKRSIKV